MTNKEIYLIEIISCASKKYWYHNYIGSTFYTVVDYEGVGIKFRVINNPHCSALTIDYKDAHVLEKVTKVILPQEN